MEVKIGVQTRRASSCSRARRAPTRSRRPSARRSQSVDGVLALVDEKGRQRHRPRRQAVAYVEIGEADQRRVGFGAI